MSRRERKRLVVLSEVVAGERSLASAAACLELSYRQAKRLAARLWAQGDAGLVHGLRGRASNRRSDPALRERAVARYAESFADYGPTLATEVLAEEGIEVSVESLRRWLKAAGLWSPKRKRKAHRRRRTRRGELVQMDGSVHDWFEGRRRPAVLMVMIDDATGCISAIFEAETQAAAFEMYLRHARAHGLPRAVYVDRASIYRSDREPTKAEILVEREPRTEFGRAMETLGTELILAMLRRAQIRDLDAANRFLETEFLESFNARFAVAPADRRDAHRVAPSDELLLTLAPHEERVVQNDWTVRWRNAYLQLDRDSGVDPGDVVTICEPLEGPVRILAGERALPWSPTRSEPMRSRRKPSGSGRPTGSCQGRKPAETHPWRGRRREQLEAPAASIGGGAPCSAAVAALLALLRPASRPTPDEHAILSQGDISNGAGKGTFLLVCDKGPKPSLPPATCAVTLPL